MKNLEDGGKLLNEGAALWQCTWIEPHSFDRRAQHICFESCEGTSEKDIVGAA